MDVKNCLSHYGRDMHVDLACLRNGRWRPHLDLTGRKRRETEEDCIMRSFTSCTLHQYGDQIKEHEMGRA